MDSADSSSSSFFCYYEEKDAQNLFLMKKETN